MPAILYRWLIHPHLETRALRMAGLGPIRETLIGTVDAADSRGRTRGLSKVHTLGRLGK
jgi:hypothetical protein